MANRKRKHGIFAVDGDVVVLASSKDERIGCTHISIALETVFKQMRIAGNRPRTIESYEFVMIRCALLVNGDLLKLLSHLFRIALRISVIRN